MSSTRWFLCGTVLTAVTAIGFAAVYAQQPGQRQRQQQQEQQNGQQVTDRDIALCLILDNLAEIKLSRFGQKQSESDSVRQYAEKMIQDHARLIEHIKQTGVAEPLPQRLQAELQQIRQQGNQEQERGQQQQRQQGQQAFQQRDQQRQQKPDMVQLKMEMVDNMLNLIRQDLQQKSGRDFDLAFMYCQIGAHQSMLAALHTFRQYASPELQQVIATALPKTQEHLQQARTLVRQLQQQSATAGRPEEPARR